MIRLHLYMKQGGFNDNTQAVRRTDDGLVNLTDLWKAAGSPKKKTPYDWRMNIGAEFIGYAEEQNPKSRVFEAKRGSHGGTFNTSSIRVVTIDGNPWFVAKDVSEILDFSRCDNMLRVLGRDERGITPHPVRGVDGRVRPHATISESGLYKLILRSDKPEAKGFQDWVTKVVLSADPPA